MLDDINLFTWSPPQKENPHFPRAWKFWSRDCWEPVARSPFRPSPVWKRLSEICVPPRDASQGLDRQAGAGSCTRQSQWIVWHKGSVTTCGDICCILAATRSSSPFRRTTTKRCSESLGHWSRGCNWLALNFLNGSISHHFTICTAWSLGHSLLIAHGDGRGFRAVRASQTCSEVRWINHALWKPQLEHRTWKTVVICSEFCVILLVDSQHRLSRVRKVPSTCTSRTSQRVNTLWSCGTSQRQNRQKCVYCQSNLIFWYIWTYLADIFGYHCQKVRLWHPFAMLCAVQGGPWSAKYDLKGCDDDKTLEVPWRLTSPTLPQISTA